jgi:hypothetical protein
MTLLERSWWKRVEVSANVYNAFDGSYAASGSQDHVQEMIPQDGRSGRITLTWIY